MVSCFFEHKGEILLLHRWPEKSQGNKWGVPAGKIERGETPLLAMIREAKEETNIDIDAQKLVYFDKIFVRYPDYDFIYHMFHVEFPTKPHVSINPKEHQHFKWVSPEGSLTMNIVSGLDKCIILFYRI